MFNQNQYWKMKKQELTKKPIVFIEEPNIISKEELSNIFGGFSTGESGLCFVFRSCKSKCKQYTSTENNTKSENTQNEKKTKILKKYDKLLCFVVTME